jgi:hypothetical protein
MRLKGLLIVLAIAVDYAFYNWLASGGAFVNVGCANIVDTIVTISAVFGLALGLVYTFKNSSPGGALIALLTSSVVTIVLSMVLLSTLASAEFVTATLCNNCSDISKFDERLQRIEGEDDKEEQSEGYRKLEAAVDDFIEVEKDREAKIPADVPETMRPKVCVADGEIFMARLLLSKLTNVMVPELRDQKAVDAESAQLCTDKLNEATSVLDRAEAYVNAHNGDQQMVQLIKTLRESLVEVASKCVLPDDKSITELDKRKNPPYFEIDVKVIDGKGDFVPSAESLIEVWGEGKKIDSKVEFIKGGEPLCLMVVADNSRSIIDESVNPAGVKNLEYISNAIASLNKLRKSTDYYGLVMFGGPDVTKVVVNLDAAGLPTDKVDAKWDNTDIWDAVKLGIEALNSCDYSNKMLVLLTDGKDNSSNFKKGSKPEEIVSELNKLANKNNVTFNVLAVGPAAENEDLKKLDTTKGAFVALNDFAELSTKLSAIAGEQQDFYRIYVPLDLIDGVKILKLRLTGGTEVTVEIGNS